MLLTISILIFVLLAIFWVIFIEPIFKNITSKIKASLHEDLIGNTKIIVSLSTAAIILTVNIDITNELAKNSLRLSWISFLACIGFSVLLLLISAMQMTTNAMGEQQLKNIFTYKTEEAAYKKDKKKQKKLSKLLKNSNFLLRSLFMLLYSQYISLFLGIILLIYFGMNNW